jgi:hypothetical protein
VNDRENEINGGNWRTPKKRYVCIPQNSIWNLGVADFSSQSSPVITVLNAGFDPDRRNLNSPSICFRPIIQGCSSSVFYSLTDEMSCHDNAIVQDPLCAGLPHGSIRHR